MNSLERMQEAKNSPSGFNKASIGVIIPLLTFIAGLQTVKEI